MTGRLLAVFGQTLLVTEEEFPDASLVVDCQALVARPVLDGARTAVTFEGRSRIEEDAGRELFLLWVVGTRYDDVGCSSVLS